MRIAEACPPLVDKPRPNISIVLPSSILETEPDLRSKTLKAGLIGRAAAIFRVDEIHVFRRGHASNMLILSRLLEYLEAPPYLKRKIFGKSPYLRFAGLLPPLQAPHHSVGKQLRRGECREGVIVKHVGRGVLVDVGIGKPILVENIRGREARPGLRITVKIMDPEAGTALPATPSGYWGYKVHTHSSLRNMLASIGSHGIMIGTSRRGISIAEAAGELKEKLRRASRAFILFGAPREGLQEIFSDEGLRPEDMHYLVNFAPQQGVKTIRTEEAVYITLGILNYILHT